MKVNLSTQLKTIEGTPLTEAVQLKSGEIEEREVKLKNLIVLSLRNQGESKIPKEQKDKDFLTLLKFIGEKEEIELEVEEVSRIIEKSSEVYDCFIAGQIRYILEGKTLPF
jgi:hypothetical protein